MTAEQEKTKRTFSTRRSIAAIVCPQDREFVEAWHETVAGFGVRVMRSDNPARARMTYLHRFNELVPDGKGGTKRKDKKERIGLVEEIDGEPAISFEAALEYVLAKRRVRGEQKLTGTQRMTVGDAWSHYLTDKQLNRESTKEKDKKTYLRFLAHLESKFLDELDYDHWSTVISELKAGTYRVGTLIIDGQEVPDIRGPIAKASIYAVLNVASNLYEIAKKRKGLRNAADVAYNSAREAKQLIGKVGSRKTYIELRKLGTAWRAADILVSPSFRDLFKVLVLTGLRRTLVLNMRFDEIDYENKTFMINPWKPGTKRRGKDIPDNAENINMPLSDLAFEIIKARREFAPDKDGAVWYSAMTKAKKPAVIHDPRASWDAIERAIGKHFTPHDLRRTFATVGSTAISGDDLYSLALLMLHSGPTLARIVGLPSITLEYINKDEAQDAMRATANKIADYVVSLAKGKQAPAEPKLPVFIEKELET